MASGFRAAASEPRENSCSGNTGSVRRHARHPGACHDRGFRSTRSFQEVVISCWEEFDAAPLRPLILAVLALWRNLSQKEIGAGSGIPQKQVSYHLKKEALDDSVYDRLLRGVRGRPAEVDAVTACLEALEALSQDQEMTSEERDAVEAGILEGTRVLRKTFAKASGGRALSRQWMAIPGPPSPLEASRWQARELWSRLEPLSEGQRARGSTGGHGIPDLGTGRARLRGARPRPPGRSSGRPPWQGLPRRSPNESKGRKGGAVAFGASRWPTWPMLCEWRGS